MKIEELLNRLIDMGWKPFNQYGLEDSIFRGIRIYYNKNNHKLDIVTNYSNFVISMNDLLSQSSGLWDFILSNRLEKSTSSSIIHKYPNTSNNYEPYNEATYHNRSVGYWTMLSSIQNNKEQFLLDNIKTDND